MMHEDDVEISHERCVDCMELIVERHDCATIENTGC